MKKVFLDTNIILDLLSRRMPFYNDAAELFSMADKKEVSLSISTLTLANTHYFLARQISEPEARSILRKIRILLTVLPFDDKISDLALNSDFRDFEDAIQYYIAIENNQEIIVTRNQQDFKGSKIPVMTAGEFIQSID